MKKRKIWMTLIVIDVYVFIICYLLGCIASANLHLYEWDAETRKGIAGLFAVFLFIVHAVGFVNNLDNEK